jgi:ABC-type branched-subunit amino acid transport system ATPase component
MPLKRLLFQQFTAFENLDLVFSPGINVLIGANGTGKTHIMKVAYSACDISKTKYDFAEKLVRVFLPSGRVIGRLVKRQRGTTNCSIQIYSDSVKLSALFSNHASESSSVILDGVKEWTNKAVETVYIPVKEMLSHAPGFRSLYSQREIHFEEVYLDIIDRAFLPVRRGPIDQVRKRLLSNLEKTIDGKVTFKNEEFSLHNKQGNLEFTLLAEGIRKLGLLWLLIQNGTLVNGSVLFWDEPEANLNPKLFGPLIEILLELQRMGVQVFLATHDYVILKEIDLLRKDNDKIVFHSLFRDKVDGEIKCNSTDDYLKIDPNAIQDTFVDLFDRDVRKDLS